MTETPDYTRLRTLLHPIGTLRPQPASDWTGAGVLPGDIARFYEEIGPWGEVHHESVGPVGLTLTVGGNPVCIPPLHKLESLQAGYAWSKDPQDRLDGWDDDWLVVAEQGGDPFIHERSTGHILFAFHGAGSWRPVFFARDLATAFGALAAFATAYLALEESDFVDDEPTAAAIMKLKAAVHAVVEDDAQVEQLFSAWEVFYEPE